MGETKQNIKAMSESFFNTINLNGEELKKANETARSLEDRVLQCFYTSHLKSGMTRRQVFELFGHRYTETSCGRALTNLETKEKIRKTQEKKDGLHGKSNFVYRLFVKL